MFHEMLKLWFQWVHDWHYVGVVLLMALESTILPIPSEVVMPPAAFWAAQPEGRMTFWGVVLAGTVGSYIGSTINYWVSQWIGLPLLRRYGKYVFVSEHKIDAAHAWAARYGAAGVFWARMLPVFRHLISIPAGILAMPFGKFSLATITGSALWCTILAWWGQRVLGRHPELLNSPADMVRTIKGELLWFVLAIVGLGVLYVFVKWRWLRKHPAPAAE